MKFSHRPAQVIVALLALLLVACGPKASAKMIGKWQPDMDKLAEMDELKKMPDDQRKMALEVARGVIGSIVIEVTSNTLVFEAMGKKKVANYKVKSETETTVMVDIATDNTTTTEEITVEGDAMTIAIQGKKLAMKRKQP